MGTRTCYPTRGCSYLPTHAVGPSPQFRPGTVDQSVAFWACSATAEQTPTLIVLSQLRSPTARSLPVWSVDALQSLADSCTQAQPCLLKRHTGSRRAPPAWSPLWRPGFIRSCLSRGKSHGKSQQRCQVTWTPTHCTPHGEVLPANCFESVPH